MKCQKCNEENIEWKSGVTYVGLDEHHNPPQFMFKREGEVINGDYGNKWVGEIYTLCRGCHTGINGIHRKIIIPHLMKASGALRFNGNEQWLWKGVIPINRKKVREEIFTLSKKWVEDGNTKTT